MKNILSVVVALAIGMAAMFVYGKVMDESHQSYVTVNSIKKIAELATIEFNNTAHWIYTKKSSVPLAKDRRLLVLASGKIKGSVDMNMADMAVDEEKKVVDITFKKSAVKVSNPEIAPKGITTITLHDGKIFNKLKDKDRDKARENAIAELRKAAINGGIVNMTKAEAKVIIENFLQALGYKSKIVFL